MRNVIGFCAFLAATAAFADQPWPRHAIETGLAGADGARLRDVNGDGRPDLVVGWEQSGVVAIYLNPGPANARRTWPKVHFKGIRDVEDAVLVDLDGDGLADVVSSCEGATRAVYVHWAQKGDLLDAASWLVQPIPAAQGKEQWMFCLPMQVDGKHRVDLVVGSKGKNASVSWLEAPADPRNLASWTLHRMTDAGWIMSIIAKDMDGDGDEDVLISDRQGPLQGVRWLQNPGDANTQRRPWTSHMVGGGGEQVLFLDTADLDADGLEDIVVTRPKDIVALRRLDHAGRKWESHTIPLPENVGTGKAVTVGDVDGNGKLDLVLTCEQAGKGRSGVVWLSSPNLFKGPWQRREISGPEGVKYDIAPLLDVDGDGDLDVITTEENDNARGGDGGLGVVWYENPRRRN